jgi:hypothetical protein
VIHQLQQMVETSAEDDGIFRFLQSNPNIVAQLVND